MTSWDIQPFRCKDLFRYNLVNFDSKTETYGIAFYMNYLARWPEYFVKAVNTEGQIIGYVMGKVEGVGENWHGHVTALSVMPEYRRTGLASSLMRYLEESCDEAGCYFVDLFVRVSNTAGISLYEKLGYSVYRTVIGYYSGNPDEDAYDMRKALPRDVHKKSIIPLPHPVRPEDIE